MTEEGEREKEREKGRWLRNVMERNCNCEGCEREEKTMAGKKLIVETNRFVLVEGMYQKLAVATIIFLCLL